MDTDKVVRKREQANGETQVSTPPVYDTLSYCIYCQDKSVMRVGNGCTMCLSCGESQCG